MASRIDDLAASDFPRAYGEATEDVIRRLGGNAERTETLSGIIEFRDVDRGGLVIDDTGQYLQHDALLELAADQETTSYDTWVVRGEVYQQIGSVFGKDGGSQTISLVKRKGQRGREPRVSNQRR